MTRFAVFAVLYMTAFLMEVTEDWEAVGAAAAWLVLIATLVWTRITRPTFACFLVLSTVHFLVGGFPDVANHVNLLICCNLALLAGMLRSYASDDEYFETMLPVLRASLIVVYFSAGFHKLNRDFIDPEVSCIRPFLGALESVLVSPVAGMPGVVPLGAVALVVLWMLGRDGPRLARAAIPAGLSFVGLLASALGAGWVLAPASLTGLAGFKASCILAAALVVLFWELIEGPLLVWPKFQPVVLSFSLGVHCTLAVIGFVDFQSLALALLMTFVPLPVFLEWERHATFRLAGRTWHRLRGYFLLNAVGGLLSGVHYRVAPIPGLKTIVGIGFVVSVILLLWPLVVRLGAPATGRSWEGVRLWNPRTPVMFGVFPVALLLFGMTSYLGLRTAGNFSMFSNLRTEGATSNHLLLGGNPWKVWHYTDDLVSFVAIDDEQARIGHKYRALAGMQLPLVEFRKLIDAWTRAGRSIPLTFEHGGRVYTTPDVVEDPVWRTRGRDWEMRLLDFRVVQREGRNACRW